MPLHLTIVRSDRVRRIRSMFSARSRRTWIDVHPLDLSATLELVSRALHRPPTDCEDLAQFIQSMSSGNAFAARNILTTLQRHHLVCLSKSLNAPVHQSCVRLPLTGIVILGNIRSRTLRTPWVVPRSFRPTPMTCHSYLLGYESCLMTLASTFFGPHSLVNRTLADARMVHELIRESASR
jgi:hypothetical protein